jgi:hypothetical protein
MSVAPNRRAAFKALRLDDDDPRRADDARSTYGVETNTLLRQRSRRFTFSIA